MADFVIVVTENLWTWQPVFQSADEFAQILVWRREYLLYSNPKFLKEICVIP